MPFRVLPTVCSPISFSTLGLALALSACGSASKPSDTQISTYLTHAIPSYLQLGAISSHIDAATDPDGAALPPGSWRVAVDFTAKAQQDLFALAPGAAARRLAFERGVSEAEQYRVRRIEAVNSYAAKMGLMKEGAVSPEPAMPMVLTHKAGDNVTEHVTLIAKPDGAGWVFLPTAAAPDSETTPGAPMDVLRQQNANFTLVAADSPQDRESQLREQSFLKTLAKAPKP